MNKNKPIPKSQVRKTPHGWQVYAAGPKGHIAQGQPHKDLGTAKRDAKKFEETEMDEGPPSQKFKPLKHKVWSADASIPAGARPKDPGKPAKYKVSKKTGMGFGAPTNEDKKKIKGEINRSTMKILRKLKQKRRKHYLNLVSIGSQLRDKIEILKH